jgi:hypothetical protein
LLWHTPACRPQPTSSWALTLVTLASCARTWRASPRSCRPRSAMLPTSAASCGRRRTSARGTPLSWKARWRSCRSSCWCVCFGRVASRVAARVCPGARPA